MTVSMDLVFTAAAFAAATIEGGVLDISCFSAYALASVVSFFGRGFFEDSPVAVGGFHRLLLLDTFTLSYLGK